VLNFEYFFCIDSHDIIYIKGAKMRKIMFCEDCITYGVPAPFQNKTCGNCGSRKVIVFLPAVSVALFFVDAINALHSWMLITKLPRWIHKFYAWALGYFWRPCPLCADYFGGHECEPGNIIYTSPGRGLCVCPNCGEVVKKEIAP
jgi:hypothetical protein